MRSCLASRRSVSGWGLVTHGAMALQPNGFRFRFIPEGAWRLSWQFPGPTGSSQKGTPRGLRTLTELFALPSFSALALPVILLRLRHFLPVIRPWWSVFAPFTSLAAAASAKDKAEARAAAAAKANASAMNRVRPLPSPPHLRSNQGGGFVVDLPYQIHH